MTKQELYDVIYIILCKYQIFCTTDRLVEILTEEQINKKIVKIENKIKKLRGKIMRASIAKTIKKFSESYAKIATEKSGQIVSYKNVNRKFKKFYHSLARNRRNNFVNYLFFLINSPKNG